MIVNEITKYEALEALKAYDIESLISPDIHPNLHKIRIGGLQTQKDAVAVIANMEAYLGAKLICRYSYDKPYLIFKNSVRETEEGAKSDVEMLVDKLCESADISVSLTPRGAGIVRGF